MSDTITYSDVLQVEECCRCHISFAIPIDMYRRARRDPDIWFHCPNGHNQHYPGPSEAEKLRAELDQMKADRDYWRERREATERSNRALRGHLTRWRKRVANGVCPVAGCKRHFPNVQAHVATVHPEWLAEHPEVFEVQS